MSLAGTICDYRVIIKQSRRLTVGNKTLKTSLIKTSNDTDIPIHPYLSIYPGLLFIRPSIRPPVRKYVRASVRLSVRPSVCTSSTSPPPPPPPPQPRVLNLPPCLGPGGSIPTGNVASLVSSNCPLWKERRGNTTRLPWVATRKPEEGILEVKSYWEFGLSCWLNRPLWPRFRCRRVSVRPGTVNRLLASSPRKNLFFLFLVFCIILILTVCP